MEAGSVFLQIVLVLVGAIIGLIGQLLPRPYQRIGLYVLVVSLIAVSSAWGGYRYGINQVSTATSQPPQIPSQTSTANVDESTQSVKVTCTVNGRQPIPEVLQCSSGTLLASFRLEGSTEHPDWGKVFNGLVSEINLGTGVTATDRLERWGPPGKWDTLEMAGWITLQDSTDMTKELEMFDEVSNSTILVIPDNVSQELKFEFTSTSANFMVATLCEYSNPCRGQIVQFVFVP